MALKTYGPMAVDWENRIDFDRLRCERLARAKALLAKSELGALLCFDMNNVRYLTATHIGTWAQDKCNRFTLLPQNDEPILWDFGSAARHHQLHCPWLGERSRPGISMLRGAMSPEMGRAEDVAKKIRIELEMRGLHKEPLGLDIIEPPVLFALQKEGITVADGQQIMSDARVIKTQDEITLLNMSAMMVDAAYDELYRAMKPGMSENQAVGLVSKVLYDLGSEYVEAVNAISGERCNPHPHVFSDRVLRPGDPVYYDILHSYMGYRTCYYRCFTIGYASHAMVDAYKCCREYLDAAIELIRPGRTTAQVASVWPKAQEFGFPDEEAAFALQFGHGVGLAIWWKPARRRKESECARAALSRKFFSMAVSVVMPALEMAQETGKVVSWRKREGEQVAKGEPLLEVETDKAVVEVESPGDGILSAVSAREGAVIPVGQTIAWLLAPGEAPPLATAPAQTGRRTDTAGAGPGAASSGVSNPPPSPPPEMRISPKARRLAREHGVDVTRLRGSGPGGEILAEDIMNAAKSAGAAAAPAAIASAQTKSQASAGEIEPLGTVGRLMAARTTQSWTTVPHFFVTRDADASGLLEVHDRLSVEVERTHGFQT